MIDQLIQQIQKKKNPVCAGLDTRFEYVPPALRVGSHEAAPLAYAAECIFRYNTELIDAIADIVPAVKIQAACYEMYGPSGVDVFARTILYARRRGLITIADVKRNDIGSTAEAYASAYIGRTDVDGTLCPVFDADFMTVNAYLGGDGVVPFLDACAEWNRGIFVLVKTSNPSSGELQDLMLADGVRVYERMMDRVDEWGKKLIGKSGFSDVGAVVGATYPEQAVALREQHPGVFFLLPGVGAQGGDVAQLAACFDKHGRGAIINNSRQMLTAWKTRPDIGEENAPEAARRVLLDMRNTINEAFEKHGIRFDGGTT